jgi:hypothetical protein
VTPQLGETWRCDLQGKVGWLKGGSAGDTTGLVKLDWHSTDRRVYEGIATKGKRSERVTLAANYLLEKVG